MGNSCLGESVKLSLNRVPVMASTFASLSINSAKPSPCRIGDCFGRKERSLAMTAALSNYK